MYVLYCIVYVVISLCKTGEAIFWVFERSVCRVDIIDSHQFDQTNSTYRNKNIYATTIVIVCESKYFQRHLN